MLRQRTIKYYPVSPLLCLGLQPRRQETGHFQGAILARVTSKIHSWFLYPSFASHRAFENRLLLYDQPYILTPWLLYPASNQTTSVDRHSIPTTAQLQATSSHDCCSCDHFSSTGGDLHHSRLFCYVTQLLESSMSSATVLPMRIMEQVHGIDVSWMTHHGTPKGEL